MSVNPTRSGERPLIFMDWKLLAEVIARRINDDQSTYVSSIVKTLKLTYPELFRQLTAGDDFPGESHPVLTQIICKYKLLIEQKALIDGTTFIAVADEALVEEFKNAF